MKEMIQDAKKQLFLFIFLADDHEISLPLKSNFEFPVH